MRPAYSPGKAEMERIWREWESQSACSFFQTYEWASLLDRHFPFLEPFPVACESWFIPLMRSRRWGWLSDSLYGMPFMTPGGILREHELDGDEWHQLFEELRWRQVGTIAIVLTPEDAAPEHEGFSQETLTTHLVDLTGGWEAVWARYRQKARTATRKAELLGITIRPGEGEEDIHHHWEIVKAHFGEWEPKPEPTFEFVNDAAKSAAGKLYLAEHEGMVVGSVLVFSSGQETFFWQGARLPDCSLPGISNLLYSKVLQDACEHGFARANLGASLGNPRIEAFKQSLGGQKVPCTVIKRVHPCLRFLKRG